jgi:hypothetical protein
LSYNSFDIRVFFRPYNDERCSENTFDDGEEADGEVEKSGKVRETDVQIVCAQHQKAHRGQISDHLVHHHQESAPSRNGLEPVAASVAEEVEEPVAESQVDSGRLLKGRREILPPKENHHRCSCNTDVILQQECAAYLP